MSRILRHLDNKDFRKTRQRQIDEQEERAAQKLKEWEEKVKERKQIEEASRPYKSNWRNDLVEAMTTDGLASVTVDAEGDVDLVPTTTNIVNSNFTSKINWSASNGVASSADDSNRIIPGATSTVFRRADMKIPVPADKNISTVKVIVSKGGGTLNWTDRDPSENFDADLYVTVNGGAAHYQSLSDVQSGVYTFTIDPKGHPTVPGFVFVNFGQFAKIGATGQTTVRVSFQRRTPVNVFVPLDDPEASLFIRDGQTSNLSPAEKRKKLEEMLDAGDQFMIEYLGLKPSTARPVDTETEIAGYGLRPDGTSGMNRVGDTSVGHDGTVYKLIPRAGYGYNQWVPVKGRASAGEDEIALDTIPYEPPSPGPGGYKPPGSYDPNKFYNVPTNHGPQFPSPNLPDTGPGRSSVPDKDNKKKKQSVVAHHEPKGNLISEKKKLKSPEEVLKKIPGYYDGKPSPGGFPLAPPVIPINGMHPELVNPVKVADRFNRLDPISAKSMPLTGNPHIDKKVKAARKKSK